MVVTSLGVNDVTGRVSLAAWRRAQRELIAVLQARFGACHLLLSGLPPMHRFPALPQPLRWYVGSRARDFNRALARVAASRPGCEFLALVHVMMDPSAIFFFNDTATTEIYTLWAREAARRIVQRMEQTK